MAAEEHARLSAVGIGMLSRLSRTSCGPTRQSPWVIRAAARLSATGPRPARWLSTPADPLAEFKDPYDADDDLPPPGRAWNAAELRKKSSADLEKLWVVLMKERNMLLTARRHHSVMKTTMPHPERLRAVARSIARLKLVVHERNRFEQHRAAEARTERRRKFIHGPEPPPELPEELAAKLQISAPAGETRTSAA